MSTRRPGIVTRSQSGFCHGDCKSPLIEELSGASKRPSSDSEISDMSDTESGPDLREVLRAMDKLFSQHKEYLHAKLDEATVRKPKSVKLEVFSGLESQDIDLWLQKFQNRVEAGGHRHDSASMAADLASHLSGPAETFYFSLAPEIRRDFDELTAELKNRFSSEDVKWRLRQSLSGRKQGAKESLDSYIEFINSTCQKIGRFQRRPVALFCQWVAR